MINNTDIGIALWGLMGGVIRALDTAVRERIVPTLAVLTANILIAGFCGWLASHIAAKFDADWTMVAAGIGGYLGTTTIDILLNLLNAARGVGK